MGVVVFRSQLTYIQPKGIYVPTHPIYHKYIKVNETFTPCLLSFPPFSCFSWYGSALCGEIGEFKKKIMIEFKWILMSAHEI